MKVSAGAGGGARGFVDGYYQALSTMSWQGCAGNVISAGFDAGYSRLPLDFRARDGDADDEDSDFKA